MKYNIWIWVFIFSRNWKLSLKMDQYTKMSIILEGIRRGVKMAPPIASLLVALAVAACGMPARGYTFKNPDISLLTPPGIRFAYPGE